MMSAGRQSQQRESLSPLNESYRSAKMKKVHAVVVQWCAKKPSRLGPGTPLIF
jgi:hypothetical protein